MLPPRPMYHLTEQAQPKPEKKPYRMPRVGKERAKENRKNDQIFANFLERNPVCACGCGQPSTDPHHIASGTGGRPASLHDTDLLLALAAECHDNEFDDALVWPKSRQLARKLVLIVPKFKRAAATPTTLAEVMKWM